MRLNVAKKCEIANKILQTLQKTEFESGKDIKIVVVTTKTKADIKEVKIEQ